MLIYSDYLLKNSNSFNINAKAEFLVEISSIDDLTDFMRKTKFKKSKRFILGNGTNTLFTSDFKGVVLKNNLKGVEISSQTDEKVEIKVSSGENFDDFVGYCAKNRFCGIENLSGIPGSVGGAAFQNAGAYGQEVAQVVKQVDVFDFSTGTIKNFSQENCKFGYRNSIFKNPDSENLFIISVTFQLSKKFVPQIEYGSLKELFKENSVLTPMIVRRKIVELRNEKLPDYKQFGNAGSFFKNPEIPLKKAESIKKQFPDLKIYPLQNGENVKLSAAQLIDICGFKQNPDPKVGVWENQALVVVNNGAATGKEILSFAKKIIKTVKEKFSVELQPEVCII